MKYFLLPIITALGVCAVLAPAPSLAADISGEYRIVASSRPTGGTGGYTGKVAITSQGPSFHFQWTLDSGESYSGPALMLNGVVGVGYGDGLTGLAVYAIKGKSLKAKWLLPATPQQVGEYELTGLAGLNGVYKFTSGLAGGVTIKPNGKIFDLAWSLPTGSFTGVAVRVGDVLVAVSGTAGSNFGVAAYQGGKDRVKGIWTMPGQSNFGTEDLVPAAMAAAAAVPVTQPTAEKPAPASGAAEFGAEGAEVRFVGETYGLQNSASAPGKPTSELREYLRSGDNFDGYAKMFCLRIQNVGNVDPLTFSRSILAHTKKEYPDATTNEIEHTDKTATMAFVIKTGSEIEFNFWHFFKVPQGIASVQFVLRNKPPFDTEDKVKGEAVEHINDYIRDAKLLTPQVLDAISKTVKSGSSASAAPAADKPAAELAVDDDNDALAGKIAADFKTAGGIAGQFLQAVQGEKFDEAAGLIADEGFTRMKTTKKDFLAKLQKVRAMEGRLLSFTPDRGKPDFGPEAGGIYFVLAADSKYEKSTSRETLRFLRFRDGTVRMVGYEHAAGK